MATIDNRGTATPLPQIDLTLATSLDLLSAYVAHLILMPFVVMVQQGTMPITGLNRQIVTVDSDEEGYPVRLNTDVDGKTFLTKRKRVEVLLPDDSDRVYGTRERAQTHKAKQGTHSMLIAREASCVSLLQTTGTFGSGYNAAAAAKWDTANGDPIADLVDAAGAIEDKTGVPASEVVFVMTPKAFRALCKHTKTRELAKAFMTGTGALPMILPTTVIAACAGVKNILIARAPKHTNAPGKTKVAAGIWSDTSVLGFLPAVGGQEEIGLGLNFVWDRSGSRSELSQAVDLERNDALAFSVEEYRDERAESDVVRVAMYDQPTITNKDAGYLITTVL
jgi:hypothetical protein